MVSPRNVGSARLGAHSCRRAQRRAADARVSGRRCQAWGRMVPQPCLKRGECPAWCKWSPSSPFCRSPACGWCGQRIELQGPDVRLEVVARGRACAGGQAQRSSAGQRLRSPGDACGERHEGEAEQTHS